MFLLAHQVLGVAVFGQQIRSRFEYAIKRLRQRQRVPRLLDYPFSQFLDLLPGRLSWGRGENRRLIEEASPKGR